MDGIVHTALEFFLLNTMFDGDTFLKPYGINTQPTRTYEVRVRL
jgi:hypothetical protein